MDGSQRFLTTKAVKQRYDNKSDMTLWRWEHDAVLPFPAPLVINRRKYYDLAKIEEWERARAASAASREKVA